MTQSRAPLAERDTGAIYWAPLLHFYQPPTQTHNILQRITDECYRPLVRVFLEHPNARATLNINAVLSEMLHDHGYGDVLEGLRELGERGQVEFTGSARYHAILPLIPRAEQRRQIQQNHAANRRLLGKAYAPQGLFPPEMCYGPEMMEAVESEGFRWFVMSGVGCPGAWPMNVVDQVEADGGRVSVFFRDDVLSNRVSFGNVDAPGFLRNVRELGGYHKGNVYVVTAQDAETFGHHIKGWEKDFLGRVFVALGEPPDALPRGRRAAAAADPAGKPIRVSTISALLDVFPPGDVISPKPSSWSTSAEDLKAGNPYPLWSSPGNVLHALLWDLVGLTIDLANKARDLADTPESKRGALDARRLLDEALHSDQWWWASRRPMWSPDMVLRGVMLQEHTAVAAYGAIAASTASSVQKRELYYKLLAARHVRGQIEDALFPRG